MEEKKLYIWRFLILFILSYASFAGSQKVLISFSMPEKLLEATLRDCERLHIPALLNGLYQDSMPATMNKIAEYAALIPELSVQIDPTLFERYQVNQVPAVIWEEKDCADIVYGNQTLDFMLEKIKNHGACQQEVSHV
jgi:conjugal transfer pilus assembly protein TrbC